ncbi:prenyltransferase [Miltoncostaea marina]|uniref:prenyltransferase n=1 Tax=Miltoncostaea marina TaxID=2843215 RepID=UPI001C3DBCD7|nr:prenyltransferase [Miltoncostaea marina]
MDGARRALLGLWLEIRVIPVLQWSFTAITLGTALAWRDGGGVSVPGYLVAVAVGVLLQGLVAHSVNEIVDWRSGTDRDPAPRVISGGSKVIASGLLGPRALAGVAWAAGLSTAALGALAAVAWGWPLALYGVAGLAGAVLYTLPPVRAAYRPYLGETIAFACVWACVTGAYVVQRGEIGGAPAAAGLVYAASCVAMLMMHHYLDRGPDSRADPPKRTTIVVLGPGGRRYAVLWAAAALAGALALTAAVDAAFALAAAGFAVALVLHRAVDPDDPASVTRAELGVILTGMAGGLAAAVALAPGLAWALVPVVVLVPLELAVAGAAHRDLMAARAPAPAAGRRP